MLRVPFLERWSDGLYWASEMTAAHRRLKLLVDGSLIGRTAYVSQPLLEDPRPDNTGLPMYTQEELDELIWRAHSRGWQVAIHAIGDRGIEMCLDGYQKALERQPRADHRHRLEHCGINRPELIQRMRQLGVIPVGQPPFIISSAMASCMPGRDRCQLTSAACDVAVAGSRFTVSTTAAVRDSCRGRAARRRQDYAPDERLSVSAPSRSTPARQRSRHSTNSARGRFRRANWPTWSCSSAIRAPSNRRRSTRSASWPHSLAARASTRRPSPSHRRNEACQRANPNRGAWPSP